MSERDNDRKPKRHGFRVDHQCKQRLLLRALNEMDTTTESREESAVVVEMIARLEEVLADRERRRTLAKPASPNPRKRCTYGTSKPNVIATCEERNDHA
jgi:hypothetical protein